LNRAGQPGIDPVDERPRIEAAAFKSTTNSIRSAVIHGLHYKSIEQVSKIGGDVIHSSQYRHFPAVLSCQYPPQWRYMGYSARPGNPGGKGPDDFEFLNGFF
jgi:hypothetical protein